MNCQVFSRTPLSIIVWRSSDVSYGEASGEEEIFTALGFQKSRREWRDDFLDHGCGTSHGLDI